MQPRSDDFKFGDDDFIQEGICPDDNHVIFVATCGDDYDEPKNRIVVWNSANEYMEFFASGDSFLSIDASDEGWCFALSENGSVIKFKWKSQTEADLKASREIFVNSDVVQKGPLRRLRLIGDSVLLAGSSGQAYELSNSGFRELEEVTDGARLLTIEDLAGEDINNFMAVTSEGLACEFDGLRWTVIDLPTNSSLTSIAFLDNKSYAICGKNGILLIGERDQWQVVDPISGERSYWGIAQQGQVIYLAHLSGVDYYDGSEIKELTIPDYENLDFTVLRSSANRVYSFAGQSVGVINELSWLRLI